MLETKIFTASLESQLEHQINKFIQQYSKYYSIVDIKFSTAYDVHSYRLQYSAMILYETK